MEEILGVQVVGLQKCCLLSHFSEDKVKKFTLMWFLKIASFD